MTITEYANTGFAMIALRVAGDGTPSAIPLILNGSLRAEDIEFDITSLAPPPPPPASGEAAIAPGTIAGLISLLDPVTITATGANSIVFQSIAPPFNLDTGNLGSTTNYVGSVLFDQGLGDGPQSLDIMVVVSGVETFVIPLSGTLPPIVDETALDAFIASVSLISPVMSTIDINNPVGLDDLLFGAVTNESVIMFGDSDNDTFIGTEGDDAMYGGGGADVFYAGGGHDFMDAGIAEVSASGEEAGGTGYGGIGNDYLADDFYGGAGNDTMIASDAGSHMYGGEGADAHYGGAGFDIADYSMSTDRVFVHLPSGTATGGHAEGDTFNDIDGVIGSDFADTITLDGIAGEAYGGEGRDRIYGLGGSDELHGDGGDDVLRGGRGMDSLYGGEGDDEISSQGDGGVMDGGIGNDTLMGSFGSDTAFGGDDDDRIYGGDDSDDLNGDGGADNIFGENGADYISGGEGDDRLFGGQSSDWMDGGSDSDWMKGGSGSDTMYGGEGQDRLFGDQGDDYLNGGSGRDVMYGGTGEDTLVFGSDDAIITGGADNDTFQFQGSIGFAAPSSGGATPGVGETRIVDFTSGEDVIDLGYSFSVYDLADVLAISSNNNYGMRIDIAPDHAIFIKDVKVEDLVSTDFEYSDIPA